MLSTFDRENLNRLSPRAFRSKLGDLLNQAAGQLAYREVSASAALLSTDNFVVALGAGVKTLTLPAASSVDEGFRVEVKIVGAGQVSFALTGADTIDGISGTDATSKQWERRVFTSNGVNAWYT